MRYILILAASLVLIGTHSEASKPISELTYTLNDTMPLIIDPSAESAVYTNTKAARQSGSAASIIIQSEDPGESEKSSKSQEFTLAKLILTQEAPAQHAPAPASASQPHPTAPGTKPDTGEFPLSNTSVFILFCGLIGMLAIRRNFTP